MKTNIILLFFPFLLITPKFINKQNQICTKNYQIMETDTMPKFSGGYDSLLFYLESNLIYPSVYKDASIQGKIVCRFIVKNDGSIVDVKIISGLDKALDDAVVELITSMPKWLPGRRKGKAVNVEYYLPVTCKMK